MLNFQKFLERRDFLRIDKDKTPTKKVKMKTGIRLGVNEKSLKPRMTAPMVAGINRAKEKLNASRGDKPIKRPLIIVVPDRETPGNKAIH
jgi:hypothetical protein